jgi:hypothetical protein
MTTQEKTTSIKDFILYCKKSLQITKLPKIQLITDHDWVVSMRSFGQYIPHENKLIVYIGNRNLADILRTISHELVHHKQNEMGTLTATSGETGSSIENEANALSGMIMRNYGQTKETIYESSLSSIMNEVVKSQYTIYCDMDGVLCDFDAQFEHYYGMLPLEYAKEKGREILRKAVDEVGEAYWSKMPWMPGSQALWNYISKYEIKILTSPSSFIYAKQGKLKWIKDNLNPKPNDIIFAQTGDKHEILSSMESQQIRKSILIDDYYRNIAPWKDMGAIGITFKNSDQTISILKKFGL